MIKYCALIIEIPENARLRSIREQVFVLAHGSLGEWDEIVFLSIAAIFLIMMGISWVRSRVSVPDELNEESETPLDSQDRFPLE